MYAFCPVDRFVETFVVMFMQDLGASEAGPFAPRQSASQDQPQAGLQGNAASQQVSPAAARDAMAAEAMGLQCVALLLPPPAPSPSDALTGEVIKVVLSVQFLPVQGVRVRVPVLSWKGP